MVFPLTSASSDLMTMTLNWRNDQSSQSEWVINKNQRRIVKVICSKIGALVATVLATIETVAYAIIFAQTLPLFFLRKPPHRVCGKFLQSASFTIIWGLKVALKYNSLNERLDTKEPFARVSIGKFLSFNLVRQEDLSAITLDARVSRLTEDFINGLFQSIAEINSNPLPSQKYDPKINEGANFIIEHVLRGASNSTIDLFKQCDSSTLVFILSKAIYIYTAGNKKNDPIPNFFKERSKEAILALREELKDTATLQHLGNLHETLDQFEKEPETIEVQAASNKLKNIAWSELQGGFLATKCFARAIQKLSE